MIGRDGDARSRDVIVSGCSGGGKSTLLGELAARGFATVPEPGRRIVEQELQGDGRTLPWVDPEAFARRAIAMASDDRRGMDDAGDWVFFDRGLVDAAVALQHVTGTPAATILVQMPLYHRRIFLTPPWPEIFVGDDARRHDLADAVAEYGRLLEAYATLGYETIELPKIGVRKRADHLLALLGSPCRD